MYYLYGITERAMLEGVSERVGIGKPPRPVKELRVGDYNVIVSELNRIGALTPADAVAHSNLLEDIGQSQTVIPVRLGTVADDLEDLSGVVKNNQNVLSDLLHRLTGRMEVGIKIYWTDKLLQETVSKYVDLDRAQLDSMVNPARERDIAIEVGQVAAQITDGWRESTLAQLAARLGPRADDMAIGRLTSIYMLANVSFLIRRDAGPRFRDEVDQFGVDIGEGFQIHYVDSLPPFNFANLILGRKEHGGIVS